MKLLISALLVSVSTSAFACETRVNFSLASYHHKAKKNYNESNFGLGLRYGCEYNNWYGYVEAGQYKNSYAKQSKYGITGIDYKVYTNGDFDIRIGGFMGIANYPGLAKGFKKRKRIAWGDNAFVAGIQTTFSYEDISLHIGALPMTDNAKGLFTMQVSYGF